MMKSAVLGLGSNVDATEMIELASAACSGLPDLIVRARSPIYASAPWGDAVGARYLNAALLIETTHTPWGLLGATRDVERSLGRRRGRRNAPRCIDIDLLWYEGSRLAMHALSLPHPRLSSRRFALRPLVDVKPDAVLAPGVSARAALLRCPDRSACWQIPAAAD